MICEKCELYDEINRIGRYLIDNNLGEDFFRIQYNHLSSGESICESCGSKMNSAEYFYNDEDDLFDELGNVIAEKFSDLRLYDGSLEDDMAANISKDFSECGDHPEELLNLLGSPETIKTVIEERLTISPNTLELVAPSILTYLNDEVFHTLEHEYPADLTTNVLTEESREYTDRRFYGVDTSKVVSELDALVSYIYTISDEELCNLQNDETNDLYLENNQIYNNLKEYFFKLNKNKYGVSIGTKRFYRARVMEDKEFKILEGLNKNELKIQALTPPIGISSQGRWNKNGKPTTLYVSDKYSQLSKEVGFTGEESGRSLVIFELMTNKSRFLIPLSLLTHSSKLYAKLNRTSDKNISKDYKQEYVLSNLIGKIIRNSGYDGIIYDPTVYSGDVDECNGLPMNYAIFNPDVNNLNCFKDVVVNNFFKV